MTERYFFCHLQKTAGTSLWFQLHRVFDEVQLYPNKGDGPKVDAVLVPDHLVDRWRARRDEIRVVTGHFPLCTTELLDAEFRTFTILREPVERTLSALRHHIEVSDEHPDGNIEALYDEPYRRLLTVNHMVKMLSLTTAEMTGGALTDIDIGQRHIDMAKRALESIDVVGLQHRYDDFIEMLNAEFGWQLGETERFNTSRSVEVGQAFIDRVRDENAADIELFDFACQLVE